MQQSCIDRVLGNGNDGPGLVRTGAKKRKRVAIPRVKTRVLQRTRLYKIWVSLGDKTLMGLFISFVYYLFLKTINMTT